MFCLLSTPVPIGIGRCMGQFSNAFNKMMQNADTNFLKMLEVKGHEIIEKSMIQNQANMSYLPGLESLMTD